LAHETIERSIQLKEVSMMPFPTTIAFPLFAGLTLLLVLGIAAIAAARR
jgi:hypothetical protein